MTLLRHNFVWPLVLSVDLEQTLTSKIRVKIIWCNSYQFGTRELLRCRSICNFLSHQSFYSLYSASFGVIWTGVVKPLYVLWLHLVHIAVKDWHWKPSSNWNAVNMTVHEDSIKEQNKLDLTECYYSKLKLVLVNRINANYWKFLDSKWICGCRCYRLYRSRGWVPCKLAS